MKKRITFFGFILFSSFALSYLFYSTAELILNQTVTAWTDDQRADCGIVLTGGPGRVREGFDLLTQGRIKKLVISGVYPQAELREIFPQLPFYGPINPEDVILEKRSASTYGNAQQSLPYVEALRCRNVILITSRLHMYRSFRIFRGTLPEDVEIFQRAIQAGPIEAPWYEIFVEVTKTLFYKIWAF